MRWSNSQIEALRQAITDKVREDYNFHSVAIGKIQALDRMSAASAADRHAIARAENLDDLYAHFVLGA